MVANEVHSILRCEASRVGALLLNRTRVDNRAVEAFQPCCDQVVPIYTLHACCHFLQPLLHSQPPRRILVLRCFSVEDSQSSTSIEDEFSSSLCKIEQYCINGRRTMTCLEGVAVGVAAAARLIHQLPCENCWLVSVLGG